MALTYSKRLYLHLSKYSKRNLFPSLGNNSPNFLSVVCYSNTGDPSRERLSSAMKAYLERAEKYDKFMKEQMEEYESGKKFLANMMGRGSEEMTQAEVDEAIEYLFPSALFVPKSRPMLKPPQEIFEKHKAAIFDTTGRPFHFLFYTTKPNFSQCLHEAASVLDTLNRKLLKMETPPAPFVLPVGKWWSKEDLEKSFLEKLYDVEYEKFVEVFTKLSEHKFASTVEKYILKYWRHSETTSKMEFPVEVVEEDGVKIVKVEGLTKKLCVATVTLKCPGKGDIRINNLGIEYFDNLQRRQQIIFPLLLTDMLGKVDIEATAEGSGDASQAAAIRLGVARALKSVISPETALKLKVAGLLENDPRRRERKKPGREGARRRYTWLKR